MKDGANSGAEKEDPSAKLTPEDLIRGRQTVKFIRVLCVVVFLVSIGVAVFVFLNVPMNTRMPYSGRFGRNGIPAYIAMAFPPLFVFIIWKDSKKSDAHRTGKGACIAVYILGTTMVLTTGFGQWILADRILTAGGYFSG